MRRLPLFLMLVVMFSLTGAVSLLAAPVHHSLVEVSTDDPADLAYIRAHLDQLDVVASRPGVYVHLAATPGDLDLLRASGLQWRILDADMETSHRYADKGNNFGVYHTYSESAAFLDSLRLLYPQVVSAKFSLGQSGEGREIFAIRVSDNPDVDEDEPEMLLDCLHHAREVMASEFGIMFAEYLAQNYGTDPEITWLLDNRELYIVPIVNPDGFVYNETTDPNGGGMWRKTRRDNGNGTFGVDPNRNYPYMWAYDNVGSSSDPGSETYRGPYAGSEPEVQAMMNFINAHGFVTGNSVHTYSNLTLYPWGYTSDPTPDDAIFDRMAAEMTRYNDYTPGQPGQILYDVNGGSFDWYYGGTTNHQKIFAFSNEIGGESDGFWPAEDRRRPLFEENIWPNIYLLRAAGPFVTVNSPVVTATEPTKAVAPGDDGLLDLTIENQAAAATAVGGTLHFKSDDPWVQFGATSRTYGSLPAMSSATLGPDAIPFSVDPGCPAGHRVDFTVTVVMPEGALDYPLSFTVGEAPSVFREDFEAGNGNWTLSGDWALTSADAHSPASSLTDSPGGDYANNSSTAATLDGVWRTPRLGFWTRFGIENGWDFGYVQVSADGGPWTTVRSYTGTRSAWSYEEIDLSAYDGQDLAFRFALQSDSYVVDDGWYIDDVVLYQVTDANVAPATPAAVSPLGGTITGPVTLTVANSTDPDGDTIAYGFRIYSDADGTAPVASVDAVSEGTDQTSWTAPALPDGDYWWRAYAADAVERSPLSPLAGFSLSGASGVGPVLSNGPGLEILGGLTGSSARIRLNQPTAAPVEVDIFDARGMRVRNLVSGSLDEGAHVLVWDGRNSRGANAASGVYFVRAVVEGMTLTGRVVLVR